ncbi:MAG: Rieske 2Fe-2S domain-containing protein [Candidatus Binataceae bacterium]|nr:Rieske 2Fe-2S domain-containing protein [Candidatus Binataceae bacterium]
MLTKEENDRLTRVGPGTPCGELLRRYWHPLCPAAELTPEKPKKRIKVMGEDLVVLRTASGRYACIEEHCPHRGASLYYGFVEGDAIRCCYHGWKYELGGQCIEQPFEPKGDGFKDRIRLVSYPVQKLAGLLFVYMGPDPAKAPLLPRWDVLVRNDGRRTIQLLPIHRCNWLQCEENTADSVHTYYLHGQMWLERRLPNQADAAYYRRPIEHYDWKVCEWGIEKELVYGGDPSEVEIRPPLIFPNILRIPQGPVEAIHWRVPIDDYNTRIVWVGFLPAANGEIQTNENEDPPIEYLPDMLTPEGEHQLTSFYSQDRMAWESQGPIFDRSREHLGASDRGVVMFRRMLAEQIARVERGEEPTVAVARDPERNRMISFPSATRPWGTEAVLSLVESGEPIESRDTSAGTRSVK